MHARHDESNAATLPIIGVAIQSYATWRAEKVTHYDYSAPIHHHSFEWGIEANMHLRRGIIVMTAAALVALTSGTDVASTATQSTLRGRTSCFNDSVTASGISARTHAGIATRYSSRMKGYWRVKFANGRVMVLQQIDWGPAKWTGRPIDISGPAAKAAGYGSNCDFSPVTDTVVRATYLGKHRPSK
jgi:hypothetical protein